MKLILAYKRRKALVDDTHLLDGYLQEDSVRLKLNGKTYAELIFELSERLRGLVLTPHDEVAVIRLEQPSVVHAMDDNQVEMIRTHPHKYIEATSLPPQRIVLKVDDKVPVGTMMATSIRAGIETLVDAFGEELYVQIKDGKAECPLCGRWRAEAVKQMDVWVMCEDCGAVARCGLKRVENWAPVLTAPLLERYKKTKPRFFFPRLWNISGPWVTHEDLQARYAKYLEEKENADY